MKKIITVLLVMSLIIKVNAQSAETIISGSITDTKNATVEAATISLIKAKDSLLVKISVIDKAGKFSFTGIPYGTYYVAVSSVNFMQKSSKAFEISASLPVYRLDVLVLELQAKNLNTVTVTSKKPLIEQKIDMMVVNVDASVTNVGSTALEVLEKSPGVLVDKDGNISLKGKPSVMIMIDGKPSYLSSAELANLLSSMNANQLSQIEIMTNPSAKYDAAGNAGVINIKTKKSLTQGFNGNITLSYGQGVYSKSNNSLSLNYRTDKINAFMNYGYSFNNSFLKFDIQRNFLNASGVKISEIDQLSRRINNSQNNNLKLGMDYFINKQSTIGFSASGFITPQSQKAPTTSTLKDGSGTITSVAVTNRDVDNTWKNGAANINFHTASAGSNNDLLINLDYLHYNFSGNQLIDGLNYSPSGMFLSETNQKNILPLGINIYSARADYSQPLSNGIKMETGLKTSIVKTTNESDFFNFSNNVWKPDSSLSNSFNYKENINAAYINLNKTFGKWTVQAGLRLENTNYDGTQASLSQKTDSTFKRNYVNLFPSAFASYEVNDKNRFGISFSKRVDRPGFRDLNPFISFVDKYTYSTGNPFLQPQFSYNAELSHTYKNMFTTTVNYSITNGMINETLSQKDSLIIRSVGNIGTRYNWGISESASIPITPWLTSTIFANLYNNKYNGMINGYPLIASQLTLAFNINNQFSFQKGWSAELSGAYTSRNRDEGQAIILAAGQVSTGVSKSLLNNKASIKFNVRDIFYTQNPKEIQNFQNVRSTMQMSRDTRVATIAFVWRFGVQAKSKSASSATDEQKRVLVN